MEDIFNKEEFNEDDELFTALVETTIERIKIAYERTDGKIYMSFSGGKDSTVLAYLVMMANLPTHIPFVFSNTGIELNAIKEFVDNFPYDNVVQVKPRKPFAQVLKENGKPAINKIRANHLGIYQNHMDAPFESRTARQMITGIREKDGVQMPGQTCKVKLANKHMHFLHPDTEFKISNSCCMYLKKYPFKDFEKEHDMNGSMSGVRVAEGGARAMKYKSCTTITHKHNKEFVHSTPIYDWTDEDVDKFIEKYNIEISRAYTVYGCTRTGCSACPFSKNIKYDLKVLWDYEPLKYKAMMHWLKDVYIYQGVECEWDEEYMEEFNRMQPIIEQRRKEMMDKFRPNGSNNED